jgi:hypothetical protein
MIDEKAAPLLTRVGFLQKPVNLVKQWFTGVAVAGAAKTDAPKKEQ